jgi:putative hemolysin
VQTEASQSLGSLGRLGNLEVRLARSAAEVRRAQALRYRVFYREMSAVADARTHILRRDIDSFDLICDHLLVIDHACPLSRFRQIPEIVGTYRLLRQEVAERHAGFYTQAEFDLSPMLRRQGSLRFLELGRSCVLKPYRTKRVVELLWHGIWAYALRHRTDVMIGCASLEGIDLQQLALPLSFLHHHARAPNEWEVRAQEHLRVDMNRVPASAVDPKLALRLLPPLIKGYLRVGAFVGDGAVIDHQFGMTDVCMVLPVSGIRERYLEHFGADASRYAA